jgi:Transposase DDE domain group 1
VLWVRPVGHLWRTYRGRASCENRIKELKYDFAADSFNNTVMLAYNLMSLFRQALLKTTVRKAGLDAPIQQTLQTLRYKLFAKPAYITTESRKTILHLAIAMQHRQWMQGLWDQSTQFDLPVKFAPF